MSHHKTVFIFLMVMASVTVHISAISAETVVYSYDNARRLVRVQYQNGMTVEYVYDLSGNRVHRVMDADSDDDGIADDGDRSGIAGDALCRGGNKDACDDNCVLVHNPFQDDADSDGVGDVCDNCSKEFNPLQNDANSYEDDDMNMPGEQHYGDECDPDLNNDGVVGLDDFAVIRKYFRQSVPPAPVFVDIKANGFIGLDDFNVWRKYYRRSPGPGSTDQEGGTL